MHAYMVLYSYINFSEFFLWEHCCQNLILIAILCKVLPINIHTIIIRTTSTIRLLLGNCLYTSSISLAQVSFQDPAKADSCLSMGYA